MNLLNKITKGVLVTILIIAVILVVYLVVFHNPGEGYTEFYLLDHNSNITDYPTNISQHSKEKINIGIRNKEHENTNYTVKIKKNQSIVFEYNKTLKNNEESITPYELNETSTIGKEDLDIELYKGNISNPYRTLKLKYNVTS